MALTGIGASEFVKALGDALDERARREADVHPSRVVGRNTDGSALLKDLSGECVSRGGAGGYDGEIVARLPSLENRMGTAGAAVLNRRSSAALLVVDSIDPSVFPQGSTALAVTVVGKGFTATTVFQFLLPASEEVHPGITLVSATFVDSEHYTLSLNVASDAELVTEAPLAFDDPARRF